MKETMIKQNSDELQAVLETLIEMSNKDLFDPFKELQWPASVDEDRPWMSPALMSIYNTPFVNELSEKQLLALSKWEFINFCSLNVTGIRELLLEMTSRLHTSGFEILSEYLHVLIGEENEHMWYFSKFCLNYGGKIYPDRSIATSGFTETDILNLLVFVRILVFEEIVDFYNRKMGKDSSLPNFIQQINWLHHLDEGRHIKYGRTYIETLVRQLREKYPSERLLEVEHAIKGFMKLSVMKLYRREIYIDAGLEGPGQIRKALIQHPGRADFNANLVAGTAKFFTKIGLFRDAEVWEPSAAAA